MDIYIVVGVYGGIVDSVHAFTDKPAAEAKLAEVKADLGIQEGSEVESQNSADLVCVGLDMK